MLPGFRFLFAAIVLTVSLVVFALGAAALLRSAHQEFATLPTRRPPPSTVLVQPIQQPIEAPPTLAMLRLEPRTPEVTVSATMPGTVPPEQAPVALAVEPEKTAVPETVAALPAPAAPAIETPVPTDAPRDAPKAEFAPKPEPKRIESIEPVTVAVAPVAILSPEIPAAAPVAEAAAAPQSTATLTDDDAKLSSTKIAMLGGPPVDTEPVPLPREKPAVKPVKNVVKKSPAKKRGAAARSVATATAAAPQPADPFGFPVAR